jgi:hypothetical protein
MLISQHLYVLPASDASPCEGSRYRAAFVVETAQMLKGSAVPSQAILRAE